MDGPMKVWTVLYASDRDEYDFYALLGVGATRDDAIALIIRHCNNIPMPNMNDHNEYRAIRMSDSTWFTYQIEEVEVTDANTNH
jgi:hypothetical protein